MAVLAKVLTVSQNFRDWYWPRHPMFASVINSMSYLSISDEIVNLLIWVYHNASRHCPFLHLLLIISFAKTINSLTDQSDGPNIDLVMKDNYHLLFFMSCYTS